MKTSVAPIRRQIQLCIGKAGTPVGSLVYVRQGRRENCAIAYDEAWLASPERFNVSADLQLAFGYQPHKAASPHDSVFHGAIADTAPDAWGRRVIARDHAKRRKDAPHLAALTEMDYLLAVDDFSRVGALLDDIAVGNWGLHPLTGKLKGQHAIKVSGNWRLFFEFRDSNVYLLDYDDYH